MASLRTRRFFSDDRRAVFVVESVDVRHENYGRSFGLAAWLKPVAVLVEDDGGIHAIGLDAEAADLDLLVREVVSQMVGEAERIGSQDVPLTRIRPRSERAVLPRGQCAGRRL